ncbi:hypothetical protein GRT64_004719 [Salmonella enterica]|uniref:Uncharacterized protein n=4 Tax=Salmonella enterica TaxID=28901 RepID=A0A6C7D6M6_SALER|nr:hypothetical protein [Salmonella enterica]EAA6249309.1 hypothetical protein [Salmonella enterica subsp. salamae]EBG9517361.1 hypothetical protein [Salmonella enterica subsp. enterica serovar Gaminara]EBP3810260.1 hypothetical protein [Salmonella enterica subsp. enterica]EBS3637094.1 hypothetical protein [Salmonella enterica subsp. enterica serovar Apapa]EBV0230918.1 hypothetical protein [Salmonella enterica subsp. salamae serovar Sofia]EBV3837641.1 hypothetical protein [Salmonella enterica
MTTNHPAHGPDRLRQISTLLPSLTRRMPGRERLMWEDMLKIRSADHAYGMVRGKSQGEKR